MAYCDSFARNRPYKDVFVFEETPYQKMPDGRAYNPKNKKFVNLNPHTIVDFVGVGIWPTTQPAQSERNLNEQQDLKK